MIGLGVVSGDFVYMLFVVVGLFVLLMMLVFVFNVVKLVGVVYLIYFGVCVLLEKLFDLLLL